MSTNNVDVCIFLFRRMMSRNGLVRGASTGTIEIASNIIDVILESGERELGLYERCQL